MKINYKSNSSGYFIILRALQSLFKSKGLNFTQFGAYICFISQVDFDAKHKNYGLITRDDQELAKEWNCSETTVFRNRKELINKGLLLYENGQTKVPNYYIFELKWAKVLVKIPITHLQDIISNPQDNMAELQSFIAKMEELQGQNGTQSFNVSSKSDLSFTLEDLDIQ